MPEKNKKHKRLFAGVYALVLAAFTGYVMLDTFTLPTVEIEDATGENTTMFEGLEVKKLTGSESESVQNGDDTTDDNSSGAERSDGFTKPSKGSGRGRRSSSDTNGSTEKSARPITPPPIPQKIPQIQTAARQFLPTLCQPAAIMMIISP